MSFFYSVDLPLAREVVSSLARVEDDLDEVVVDLRWRVARLHESFLGTAAGAHLAAHEDWSAAYVEMHEALVEMRRAVRTAADNYGGATEANTAMWESVR